MGSASLFFAAPAAQPFSTKMSKGFGMLPNKQIA